MARGESCRFVELTGEGTLVSVADIQGDGCNGSQILVDANGAALVIAISGRQTRGIGNGKQLKLAEGRHYLGFDEISVGQRDKLPYQMQLPAGETTLHLARFYGKPKAQLLASMGETTRADKDAEIWLPANLYFKSQWIRKLVDTQGWVYADTDGKSKIYHLLRRELQTEKGKTVSVTLRSTSADEGADNLSLEQFDATPTVDTN